MTTVGSTESERTEAVEARDRNARDLISVLLLSITAVVTAWCGFESSKWGGEMSIAFSEASSSRIQAASAEGELRSALQLDLSIYSQWVGATAEEKAGLADYVEDRFTEHFAVAFDAWQAEGMVEASPFAREEFVPPGTLEAAALSERADERFAAALVYNQRGDNYTALTVLFALVLFLTAMSQRNLKPWIGRTFLSLAIVVFTAGAIVLMTLPVLV